jgi:hypothetical protein
MAFIFSKDITSGIEPCWCRGVLVGTIVKRGLYEKFVFVIGSLPLLVKKIIVINMSEVKFICRSCYVFSKHVCKAHHNQFSERLMKT